MFLLRRVWLRVSNMSSNLNKRIRDANDLQEETRRKRLKRSSPINQQELTETRRPPPRFVLFRDPHSGDHFQPGTSTQVPPLPPILDPSLRELPFIHQALATPSDPRSYERLEFLGDAYIELVASRILYSHVPQLSAGRMTQKRQLVVRNETLAEYAVAYGFHERARVPAEFLHEGKNRENLWRKILGDMFEAYVAAVVLGDPVGGFATIEAWLAELWAPKLFREDGLGDKPENMDAKMHLSQKIGGKHVFIEYRPEKSPILVRKQGTEEYDVGVYCSGWGWTNHRLGRGQGISIKEAGIRAAMQALSSSVSEQMAKKKKQHDAAVRSERKNV